MNRIRQALLSKVRPEGFADDDANWQQRKSSQMRIRIFEAAIDCLVENGYSGLSISEVSNRSGASRGAMHHHFADKMQLVAALTEYILFKRMDLFINDYFEALGSGDDFTIKATQLHWKSVQTREYAAYIEILVAARTDRPLADVVNPLSQRFDRVWHEEMVFHFPQWSGRIASLQLVSDFVMSAHLGLLLNMHSIHDDTRIANVYKLIVETVCRVHADTTSV